MNKPNILALLATFALLLTTATSCATNWASMFMGAGPELPSRVLNGHDIFIQTSDHGGVDRTADEKRIQSRTLIA